MLTQAHYYEDETAPTGTCAVCVVGGERYVSKNHLCGFDAYSLRPAKSVVLENFRHITHPKK